MSLGADRGLNNNDAGYRELDDSELSFVAGGIIFDDILTKRYNTVSEEKESMSLSMLGQLFARKDYSAYDAF